MKSGLLTIILLGLSVLVLINRTVGFSDWATAVALVALCVFGIKACTIREFLLLLVSVVLAAVLLVTPGKLPALLDALDLAAYFAAFILLLTGLKISAERSNSVLQVGRYLTQQPAPRRFVATATGGHLLGVFLNFAAISLMAPLIQNAAKDQEGRLDAALERRQLSALLRGFAWILLWAPTTLTQAVLLTLYTDINYGRLLVLGIGTAIIMMAIGWIYDRREWGTTVHSGPPPVIPKGAFLRLGLVCAVLILGTIILQIAGGLSTALSLMFVAPAVTVVWFTAQRTNDMSIATRLVQFWPALSEDAGGLARSAIALGLSGFIGRSLAEVLPIGHLVAGLDLSAVPGWVILAALPVLITLGGQIALSPIIIVVFIGQLLQMVPDLPIASTHVVFALSAGWAISMFASPNATATLLISAVTKVPPTRLTWRWNIKYAGLCYVVLVAIFVVLDHI